MKTKMPLGFALCAIVLLGADTIEEQHRKDADILRQDPKGRIGRWGEYPAQEALGKIGTYAAAEILSRLRNEQTDLRRKLMADVVKRVYGDELGRILIQNKLAKETDPKPKENLGLALKEFTN